MSRNDLQSERPATSAGRESKTWEPRSLWRLFRRLLLLRLSADLVAILLATTGAFYLRFELGLLAFTEADVAIGEHLLAAGVWVASLMAALALNRLYEEDTLFRGGGEATRVLRSLFEAAASLSFFVFITQSFSISRSWFVLTAIGSAICLLATRWGLNTALRSARARGAFRRPVLLLQRQQDAEPSFLFRDQEFEVIRTISLEELTFDPSVLVSRSGDRAFLPPLLLVKASDMDEEELWRVVISAGEAHVPVFISAAVRTVSRDRLTVREVGGQTIVKVAPPNLSGLNSLQKRCFDVILSAVGLLILFPFLALIGIAILIASGPPVFYFQDRLGQHGRIFRMMKFRTMQREPEATPGWTTSGDIRRTSIGRSLRRFSVDELPQLWNVLRGDMSLVGPRPEQSSFATGFNETIPSYQYRLRVKPGITGWAQAHGLRGDTSIHTRAEFDNWYIEHWSIFLDLSILLRTIRQVWSGRNAY